LSAAAGAAELERSIKKRACRRDFHIIGTAGDHASLAAISARYFTINCSGDS
jgi:hypothetical protein